MKYIIVLGLVLLVVLLSACTTTGETPVLTEDNTQYETHLHDTDYIMDLPREDISLEEEEALALGLDDEYKARATYAQVIEDFGAVRPFVNIINSEVNHINELLVLYEKYNLTPVPDAWTGNIDSLPSLEEACAMGVQAEIENSDLYLRLYSQVDNQDIIAVFDSLESASRLKHLPAFQRCGLHE